MAQPNMGTPPVDLKLKEGLPPKPETMLRLFCEKFFKNKLAVAGSAILLIIIFSAIFRSGDRTLRTGTARLIETATASKCRAFYGNRQVWQRYFFKGAIRSEGVSISWLCLGSRSHHHWNRHWAVADTLKALSILCS